MKPQEVVTIFSDVPPTSGSKTYPELEEWFNKGMYIEDFSQIRISGEKYVVTFVLRYYNTTTSRDKI